MSATLVARSLALSHGDQTLFAGLDLVVAPGDVVGLVGANGAGKSTLLRLLAGLTPEGGTGQPEPAGRDLGYLPQESDRPPGETAPPSSPAEPGLRRRLALDAAEHALTDVVVWADDQYSRALERWLGPRWGRPRRTSRMIRPTSGCASISSLWMTGLSGGQAARAGLAHCCSPGMTRCCSTSQQ